MSVFFLAHETSKFSLKVEEVLDVIDILLYIFAGNLKIYICCYTFLYSLFYGWFGYSVCYKGVFYIKKKNDRGVVIYNEAFIQVYTFWWLTRWFRFLIIWADWKEIVCKGWFFSIKKNISKFYVVNYSHLKKLKAQQFIISAVGRKIRKFNNLETFEIVLKEMTQKWYYYIIRNNKPLVITQRYKKKCSFMLFVRFWSFNIQLAFFLRHKTIACYIFRGKFSWFW